MILDTEEGRALALAQGYPAAQSLLSSPDPDVREAAERFIAAADAYAAGDAGSDEAVAAMRELVAVAERAALEADDEQADRNQRR